MTNSWPIVWSGHEFNPIPQSWIHAHTAVDRDQRQGPKLLAVSAATKNDGKELLVRYAKPTNGKILTEWTVATDGDNGKIPNSLVSGAGWARSIRPGPHDPVDDIRMAERSHLDTIWRDIIQQSEHGQTDVLADGGI